MAITSRFAVLILLNIFQAVYMHIELENFYPYGLENADSSVPTNDDGSSGLVNIGFPFPFFDNDHNSLFVSTFQIPRAVCKTYCFAVGF
jgi:hypothetical protein